MTTFVLGPEGTFSHELALRLGVSEIELIPTIHGIFTAVAKGDGDGIVPIENSEAGGVGATLDGLLQYPVYITAEMYMPIHHHLSAKVPVEKLAKIFVHTQTHEQCSDQLEKLEVPIIHTSSNAASAVEMQKESTAGAVVPSFAVKLYHLPIIIEHIENNKDNVTRFVRISRNPYPKDNAEKCSVIIIPSTDRAGLLHDLLAVFAVRQINLTRIESRPSKRGIGQYIFFIDSEKKEGFSDAIQFLKTMTDIKELGCFSKIEVP
ncbi:MAG: prephenate dehydratase domain-containing protein [Methanoregulaceae archaeon]|jgi:prephenate dehydratase